MFVAALLNSQPMGFYATSQLVRDAQEHGVEVRPVDVNHPIGTARWKARLRRKAQLHPRHASMSDDILTTHAVRLGLRQIDGFSEDWGKNIESVRGRGFDSVRDLWLRTGLPPKALKKLAHADAFNSLGLSRRDALWAVKALQRAGDKDNLPLFARVRDAGARARRASAADAAGRAGDRGLSPSASVAEGASGVVPARRSRRARHRASRACFPRLFQAGA